jgi:hypothetical protein
MPATVKAPRGGKAAFLLTTLRACLKLQNVSETSGYTRRIFIGPLFISATRSEEREAGIKTAAGASAAKFYVGERIVSPVREIMSKMQHVSHFPLFYARGKQNLTPSDFQEHFRIAAPSRKPGSSVLRNRKTGFSLPAARFKFI